jgi:uncharacterized membrane protein
MRGIRLLHRSLFASGLIGVGLVGLWFGDFAGVMEEFPSWVPARTAIVCAAAALMLVGGIGLLFERTAAWASRILFFYLALWVLLLNAPIAVRAPPVFGNWSNMAEITVLLAGGWVLFAAFTAPPDGANPSFAVGARGTRLAQLLFGLTLPLLGLAHFVYLDLTAPLVPAWLPYHTGWAYLTGAAQIAAGVGVLFSIVPRLAATLEAAMLTAFTVLVWIPRILATPAEKGTWSEFTISWAISAAAWVVAASFSRDGRTTGRRMRSAPSS